MSSLRGRTRDSSWQWMLIGVVLSIGCCGVAAVGTYAVGLWQVVGVPGLAPQPTVQAAITQIVVTEVRAVTQVVTVVAGTQVAGLNATPASGAGGSATNTPFAPQPTGVPTTPPIFQLSPTPGGATQLITISTPPPVPVTGGNASATPAAISTVGVVASALQSLDQIKTVLVNIPAGPFKMGTNLTETTRALQDCTDRDKATRCDPVDVQDSFPEHDVLINQFTLEKYEVNTEQYVAFLNSLGPNSHKAGCGGQPCAATENEQQFSHIAFDSLRYTVTSAIYANRPINYVTWYGADAYCRAIGRRLPSEAEWEYAGRYPDGRIYPWGNFWEPTRALTSRPANEGGAREVNDFTTGRSQLELFNMSGNVSEWVNDWYDANSYANTPQNAVNPQGPPGGTTKVIRGGDWDAIPLYARLPHRRDAEPTTVTISIGFRCAADGGAATSNTSPLTAGS